MASSISLLVIFLLVTASVRADGEQSLSLMIPAGLPVKADHLCIMVKVASSEDLFITNITTESGAVDQESHVVLHGCSVPRFYDDSQPSVMWPCFNSSEGDRRALLLGQESSSKPETPYCQLGNQLLSNWAVQREPQPHMGSGLVVRIAGDTGINYLIATVHYDDVGVGAVTHSSGYQLTLSSSGTGKRESAILSMIARGIVPAHSISHIETACKIEEDIRMHPFEFQVHTHMHGIMASMWKVDGKDGSWHLIAALDPRVLPNNLDVSDVDVVLGKGDWITGRCTMNNTEDRVVALGVTEADEMCGIDLTYFVDEGEHVLKHNDCRTPGLPDYSWATDGELPPLPAELQDSLLV